MVGRIRTVLVFVSLVVFFFVALLLLLQLTEWEPLKNFSGRIIDGIPLTVRAVIFGLSLILILIIGTLSVRELRDRIHITKETDEGSVTIVESAITRYIKQVATDIDSVRTVRSVITSTDEGLVVDLRTKVLVTETLPRIERAIRERVRAALEETLGVGGVAAINVIIEDFEKAGSPTASSAAVADDETADEPVPIVAEEAGMQWTPLYRRKESETSSDPEALDAEVSYEEEGEDRDQASDSDFAQETDSMEPAEEVVESEPAATDEDDDVESRPWEQAPESAATEDEDRN